MRRLSPRERQILALVSEGLPDKAIAVSLGISTRTVRTHLERVYMAAGLHSRSAAAVFWLTRAQSDCETDTATAQDASG